MNNSVNQKTVLSCILLLSMCAGISLLYAEVIVDVKGPRTVSLGEEFQYIVLIKNPPNANNEMVLMYYVPPKEVEHISSETIENAELFAVSYSGEYNRVYGEGFDLQEGDDIRVIITVKAKEDIVLEDDKKETASYFSFVVADEEDEAEYSQRKALAVVKAQA